MPPHASPSSYPGTSFLRRQKACALSCLATTPVGTCTDAACSCASASWGPAVLSCLQSSCESQAGFNNAYGQLIQYCEAADLPFTLPEPSFTRSAGAPPTASASQTAHGPAASPSGRAAGSGSKPVDVSAIMASLCSLLFAIALVVGYFGIRDKLRRARTHATSTKPTQWSGGRAVASTRTADIRRSAAAAQKDSNEAGRRSSVYGANTSQFDTAGYADLELEDRRLQARLEREKAADLIRQKVFDGFFSVPAVPQEPSTDGKSHASSFSSKAAHDHKNVVGSDEDEDDDDDDEGQYVTLPTLGMGLGAGGSFYAIGSASTFDPSSPGTSRSAGSGGGGEGWSQQAANSDRGPRHLRYD